MPISKFSIPVTPQPITDVVDMDMLTETLAYKQANLNQNVAQITNTIGQVHALDLMKESDIQLRDKLLSEKVSELNQLSSAKLDDPKVAAQLQLSIAEVASNKELLAGLKNTRDARNIISGYEKLKDDPKRLKYFSPMNERNDKKKIADWQSGKTDSIGISSPTLYDDIDGKASGIMKTLAPTISSTIDGLHNVKTELRTDNDLRAIVMDTVQKDPIMQQQLAINASAVYDGVPSKRVYEEASKMIRGDIDSIRNDLSTYATRLTDTNLTAEQRNSIKERMQTLGNSIAEQDKRASEYEKKAVNGVEDPNEIKNLATNLYTNAWVKNSTRPYIINKTTFTTDPGEVFKVKRQDTVQAATQTMLNNNLNDQLDRNFKIEQEKTRHEEFMLKLNQGVEVDANGNYVSTKKGAASLVTPGMYSTLSAQQPNEDHDVIKEIAIKNEQLSKQNRNMLAQSMIDLVGKTDTALAGELNEIYKKGGQFKDFKNASKNQIEMISHWDDLLYKAGRPEFANDNEALRQYGAVANKIALNQLRMGSYDKELERAQSEAFADAKKEGFAGTEKEFQKLVKGEVTQKEKPRDPFLTTSLTGGVYDGYSGVSDKTTYGLYAKKVNEKLRKSDRLNEFYTSRIVAPEDELYNGDKSTSSSAVLGYITENAAGINIDGVNFSVNGKRAKDKVYRDNIDNVSGVRIDRIVPSLDQVYVTTLETNKEGKKIPGRTGVVQLNPEQMRGYFGVTSEDKKVSIYDNLNKGIMVDQAGKRMFLNMNADVPDMIGNIKYTFSDARDGKRGLKLSIWAPDAKGVFGEKNLNSRTFEGEGAHDLATDFLRNTYIQTMDMLNTNYPKATKEQKGKMALDLIIKNFK